MTRPSRQFVHVEGAPGIPGNLAAKFVDANKRAFRASRWPRPVLSLATRKIVVGLFIQRVGKEIGSVPYEPIPYAPEQGIFCGLAGN